MSNIFLIFNYFISAVLSVLTLLYANICRYTYGQPLPGNAWVEVCRDSFKYVSIPEVHLCLNKTAQVCEYTVIVGKHLFLHFSIQ